MPGLGYANLLVVEGIMPTHWIFAKKANGGRMKGYKVARALLGCRSCKRTDVVILLGKVCCEKCLDGLGERKCNKCNEPKLTSEFTWAYDKDGKWSPKSTCKACCAAKTLAWRRADPNRDAASRERYHEGRRGNKASTYFRTLGRRMCPKCRQVLLDAITAMKQGESK